MYNVKISVSPSAVELLGYSIPVFTPSTDKGVVYHQEDLFDPPFTIYPEAFCDPEYSCEQIDDNIDSYQMSWDYFLGLCGEPDDDGFYSLPEGMENSVDDMFEKHAHSLRTSYHRTRNRLSSLLLHNSSSFAYFCTFTFDPSVVDRKDYSSVSDLMSKYLKFLRGLYPDLKYVIVPEFHKDGAFHFHGVFSAELENELKPACVKSSRVKLFNLSSYNYGFTSVSKIVSPKKCASYIMKYITKQTYFLVEKKRYWSSRNLVRPHVALLLLPCVRDVRDFCCPCDAFPSYCNIKTFNLPDYGDLTLYHTILDYDVGENYISQFMYKSKERSICYV